ncbi:MAG: type II secretion system F family protein [Pseudomonadales bacterium]|nr:type II secretion system F family protein [Pseudomonadales bacterium]
MSLHQYQYSGRNRSGQFVQGDLEGLSKQSVATELEARGIAPISIDENTASFDVLEYLKSIINIEKVKLEDSILFSRQMYALTKAGVPVLQALQGLADSIRCEPLVAAIREVIASLESGVNLATSLGQHPQVFRPIVVSMVHVGENTGKLDDAFLQVALHMELEWETKKRIQQTARYPLMVCSAIIMALVIINLSVIPQFAKIFARSKAELPIYTKILIHTSGFVVEYGWLLLSLVVLVTVFAIRYISTDRGRYRWDKFKIELPWIGGIIKRVMLARFSRVFAMLSGAGVPVLQSLSVVSQALGNQYVGGAIAEMHGGVERGDTLTRTAMATEMFSPLVIQMMGVGEATGQMDKMLVEVAEFYEQEVDYDLKRLNDWIEPILIIFMGLLVLILALGIFLPMWELGSVAGYQYG